MPRISLVIALCVALAACAPLTTPVLDERTPEPVVVPAFPAWWPEFTERVNGLDEAALALERDAALARYDAGADDGVRLRLAYLMTRRQPIRRDLDASRELLAAIDGASEEAALRDLLKGQLDAQLALDDTRTQVRQLEGKIAELQGQLEALRAIEADLTEGRRYRESRSQ
jgi:hypothetical protein